MSYAKFHTNIQAAICPTRLIDSPLQLLAHGTDASFYRLIPKLVVKAADETDIQTLLKEAHKTKTPLTFRTAGTSLSGQAVTDSVLVKLGHDWHDYTIEQNGEIIRLQPGIIGARANQILKPYGRKIGPDPASIDSAMIGGIAANNASGMCCGTSQNSYQTLAGLRLILADGTLLDSRDPKSVHDFKIRKAALLKELSTIRQEIIEDPQLHETIKRKYKIKNTSGYGLNSFIDFEDPLDILLHLIIGSEGTLTFISEITYNTVIDPPYKSCALVIFNSIEQACLACTELKQVSVDAVELMDEASLRCMTDVPAVPNIIESGMVALLVDVRASSQNALSEKTTAVNQCLSSYELDYQFTKEMQTYANLWKIRKGLFPIVGANRDKGTSVIIEDVCFPLDQLAPATLDLQKLLLKYNYSKAIIFGHALEGNLHFVFTQSFNEQKEVLRYSAFMDELADLVCEKYDGSLKAEHGTGRNMAPFMELEWGVKAYALMKRIKKLFDPKSILNPEVIISENPKLHLENLKPIPPADELVDQCIECGFCESACPSKDLTLSPRQRIAVWREIKRQENAGVGIKPWLSEFQYQANDTCAADGMCATKCPVDIDTGKLIKQLRTSQHSTLTRSVAKFSANNFALSKSLIKTGLKLASPTGKYPKAAKNESLELPTGDGPKVIYFSSCLNSVLAPESGKSTPNSILSLLDKAGYQVLMPPNQKQLCCGMPYESKGFNDAAAIKLIELQESLLDLSEQGNIPIVCDNSPCSFHMLNTLTDQLRILDAASFFADKLDLLNIQKTQMPLLTFSVCSQQKAGESHALSKIAQACSKKVKSVEEIACCGFAGDRGFSHPELNESSLQEIRTQAQGCDKGYSTSRSCEIGLKTHSGIPFNSILQLLDECSSSL
ncbi:D-lactate dehydrogenase, putative [Lentisphaera araneosa HTCC2155]|uniref:D-lactate dehydrogenase (cytochrome) n=1 Tax=Lentisphaera araneosa HTCC2155 TaxID=313628 RepID=A6DKT8_9BACT|nr:FAD-binding and (Fe-S)-binding domain-containing protein [Lentisphaera araneosa]EDM27986.1 D-lactate dehydrogenase, putative [Lentisphaera araneosa HTCC2155]